MFTDARSAAPRVTVVITAHDALPYVAEAVASIQAQDFPSWELVAVDDASADGTGEVLARAAREDSRIVVLRRDRPGRCDALNLAIMRASGDFVAILDADDVAAPDRLRKQVALLDARPEVVAVGGAARYRALDRLTDVVARPPLDSSYIARVLPRANCLIHSAAMARRAVVMEVGGYRSTFPLCEDYDLWLRLAERGALVNLPDVLLEYRLHPTQLTATKLRRLALMHLSVQRAADLRRSGGQEPALHVGASDEEIMDAFGVELRELERTLVGQAVDRELLLRRVGMPAQADELVSALLASSSSMSRRVLRAEVAWHRARGALDAQDWPRALSALARALTLAPAAQAKRLARSVLRRVSGARAIRD